VQTNDSISFAGKAAIVTGGASGIGRACADVLSSLGAAVCIFDVDDKAAKRAMRQIEQTGRRACVLTGDAREPAAAMDAVRTTIGRFGSLDILVNNVGGMFAAPATKITPGGWTAVLHANLDSALYFSQAAAPTMLARGGAIVNIASVAGLTASPRAAHYGAAKAALINLTRTLALEWAPKVRVNCVAPDFIRTEGTEKLMSTPDRRRLTKLIPLKRLGNAGDVANAVAFLASDMAAFITSQTLVVDGGSLHRGRLDFMPTER
jgi:NAD(P)-dependent dehydrogenase (short-subunit alcohol dehydrogenase family)